MGSLFAWRSAQNRIRATHDRSSPEAAFAPALSDGARRPPPPAIEVGHGRFSDAISKHITKHTAAPRWASSFASIPPSRILTPRPAIAFQAHFRGLNSRYGAGSRGFRSLGGKQTSGFLSLPANKRLTPARIESECSLSILLNIAPKGDAWGSLRSAGPNAGKASRACNRRSAHVGFRCRSIPVEACRETKILGGNRDVNVTDSRRVHGHGGARSSWQRRRRQRLPQ